MTETISGKFSTANQAEAALAELEESGISESGITYEPLNATVVIRANINDAISVRTTIERHGGRTDVDNIPDAGTIPDDPLEFSEDSTT